MTNDVQNLIIQAYYADDGIQYSIGRLPIAGCDFSTYAYSFVKGHRGGKGGEGLEGWNGYSIFLLVSSTYNKFSWKKKKKKKKTKRYCDTPNDFELETFSVDVDLTTKLPLTWMVRNVSKIKLFSSVCFYYDYYLQLLLLLLLLLLFAITIIICNSYYLQLLLFAIIIFYLFFYSCCPLLSF